MTESRTDPTKMKRVKEYRRLRMDVSFRTGANRPGHPANGFAITEIPDSGCRIVRLESISPRLSGTPLVTLTRMTADHRQIVKAVASRTGRAIATIVVIGILTIRLKSFNCRSRRSVCSRSSRTRLRATGSARPTCRSDTEAERSFPGIGAISRRVLDHFLR